MLVAPHFLLQPICSRHRQYFVTTMKVFSHGYNGLCCTSRREFMSIKCGSGKLPMSVCSLTACAGGWFTDHTREAMRAQYLECSIPTRSKQAPIQTVICTRPHAPSMDQAQRASQAALQIRGELQKQPMSRAILRACTSARPPITPTHSPTVLIGRHGNDVHANAVCALV
jgi:hypothetical protein